MELSSFHPAVAAWFGKHFTQPTEVQRRAWPAVRAGRHALIAAPTGSGKTLAAFLSAIDELVQRGLAQGLPDETFVLYVSPLKALSNDVQKNLQLPLMGIRDELLMHGLPDVEVRAWVRTGDTPPGERERMRRTPPHIVVTTPESLYILLTSESGRRMLGSVRSVIVDEIHALAGNKRGAHLALSLERLDALCAARQGRRPVRIGLSATQKPMDEMAGFLTGAGQSCSVIDIGHARERDLALEVPRSPLEAVMAGEVWEETYERLAELVRAHRTTLIFVNTRRLAERAARHLAERLGEEQVTAHHGSLARAHRLRAEQRLKAGELKALVATASLELGIDIGEVDLVCQLGSPRAIATLLQRVGRSGHAVGAMPKGRLFPLSRDDLVECTALLQAVQRGELDRVRVPEAPLDVLAQQIVAEIGAREWAEAELFDTLVRAWPYRKLPRAQFEAVTAMLAAGFSTRRGRRGAYLHRDAVNGRLRARRGARLVAMTNGGAIPDQFDYDVVLAPEGLSIGTLNEDFAFESLPGDIFQLGNASYRILRVEQGKVHVEDARGLPPNIPFWFGEAPGRTDELSAAVSRLRAQLDTALRQGREAALTALRREPGLPAAAAEQLIDYLGAAQAALGALPTQDTLVLERFFDEAGDMHLVLHAPFGSRLNRAWGLALRKRFCRKFNFELQAAALEDTLVLSLGPTHSFPLEEVMGYLKADSARQVLVQALLDAPMFAARWRWNASIALAVLRNRNGRRLPAQFQRSDAEDLIAVVFPDQLACLENIAGEREIPDHPLVVQTLNDCLHESMDVEGLEAVLGRLQRGGLRVLCRDLPSPSPLAQEVLNARPYAFLDGAPAEERRTALVQARGLDAWQSGADATRLDEDAIAQVRAQAWPEARDADELHDALCVLGFVTEAEAAASGPAPWAPLFDALGEARRAARLSPPGGQALWAAAERLAELQAVFPNLVPVPPIAAVGEAAGERDAALRELIRSRLEGLGPVTAAALAAPLGLGTAPVQAALAALESEGFAVRGAFSARAREAGEEQWCERGLLARIHRYTLNRLRREIEAVPAAAFVRFLLHWQRLGEVRGEGPDALLAAVQQLEGFAIPAAVWEAEVLPARVRGYLPAMLDSLCASGRVAWLRPPARGTQTRSRPAAVRNTPIVLAERPHLNAWRAPEADAAPEALPLSSAARRVAQVLRDRGALFFFELVEEAGLLRTQVEQALGELVGWGAVSADAFAGLRALITPASRRPLPGARSRRAAPGGIEDAGRWALIGRRTREDEAGDSARIEHQARVLLRRYGVVFRKLLEREANAPAWRELLYVYRRLEARGEVRGGRFVQGFSGEQFALPEAVGALRQVSRAAPEGTLVAVSAADPLNLMGIVTPGARLPAQSGNRLLWRDGLPLAVQIGREVHVQAPLDPQLEWTVRSLLGRRGNPAGFLHPPSSALS